MSYVEAVDFVRTSPTSGLAQSVLVRAVAGERMQHGILEIGCGALHFAKAIIPTLPEGAYYGIDPNAWLRGAAIEHDPVLLALVQHTHFSCREDFDGAAEWERRFPVVFAHSVVSHVGRTQLVPFFDAARRAIADSGMLLCSYNRAQGVESIQAGWTYPGGVTISDATLEAAAAEAGMAVWRRDDLRELYQSWCPLETHDWLIGVRA